MRATRPRVGGASPWLDDAGLIDQGQPGRRARERWLVDIDTDQASIESLLTSPASRTSNGFVWAAMAIHAEPRMGECAPGPLSERQATALWCWMTMVRCAIFPEFRSPRSGADCAVATRRMRRCRVSRYERRESRKVRRPTNADPQLERTLRDSALASLAGYWKTRNRVVGSVQPIRGRLVLIGGTFQSRTRHPRHADWAPAGVEIFAHIVESEMAAAGLAQFNLFAPVCCGARRGGC